MEKRAKVRLNPAHPVRVFKLAARVRVNPMSGRVVSVPSHATFTAVFAGPQAVYAGAQQVRV